MPQLARHALVLALAASAPATLAAQGARKAASASAAVQEFMRAVADSNLTRMAELFGTSKGSSAVTHKPDDYQKRMVVIQAMIGKVQSRTLGDLPGKDGMHTITTQLQRGTCKIVIPVNAVDSKDGWLVHDFDLSAASQVNQSCTGGNGT